LDRVPEAWQKKKPGRYITHKMTDFDHDRQHDFIIYVDSDAMAEPFRNRILPEHWQYVVDHNEQYNLFLSVFILLQNENKIYGMTLRST
jgi:hypothetical protein